jgi:hypothetical protein
MNNPHCTHAIARPVKVLLVCTIRTDELNMKTSMLRYRYVDSKTSEYKVTE